MRRRRLLGRAILLLAAWSIAVYCAVGVLLKARTHAQLKAEVSALESEQRAREQEFLGTVQAGHKLESDPDTQVSLLKEKLGYARPNEIPIVVTIDDDKAATGSAAESASD